MESKEFLFEKLNVYQKSLNLSIEVCKVISKVPYEFGRIRDQLTGSVVSIPLNIAEGSGRSSSKEKANFYRIARGSGFECIPLLSITSSLNLISKEQTDKWRENIREICMMLSGLIKYQQTS